MNRRGFLTLLGMAGGDVATGGGLADRLWRWLTSAPGATAPAVAPTALDGSTVLIPRALVEDATFDVVGFLEAEVGKRCRVEAERWLEEDAERLLHGDRSAEEPLGVLTFGGHVEHSDPAYVGFHCRGRDHQREAAAS